VDTREKEGGQGDVEKKYGQQDTSTAAGRRRRKQKTKLDREKWFAAYVSLGATI